MSRKRRATDHVSDDDDDDDDEFEEEEEPAEQDVDSMSYAELGDALKRRGVPAKGKKVELAKQLKDLLVQSQEVAGKKLKHVARTASAITTWSLALTEDVMRQHVLPCLDVASLCAFSSTCIAAYLLCNDDRYALFFFLFLMSLKPETQRLWSSFYHGKFANADEPRKKDLVAAETKVFAKARLPPLCPSKLRYAFANCARKCVRCDKTYYLFLNGPKSCFYHDGEYGPKNEWTHEEYVWSCCRAEEEEEPGCYVAEHSTNPKDKVNRYGGGWW